jgi:hypothetical protein
VPGSEGIFVLPEIVLAQKALDREFALDLAESDLLGAELG